MQLKTAYLLSTVLIVFCSCAKHNNFQSNLPNNEVNNKHHSDKSDYFTEITQFQKKLTDDYSDPANSPLDSVQLLSFKDNGGHKYFPINPKYKVIAELDTTQRKNNIGFSTSTKRIAMYDQIGVAQFIIDSIKYSLNIYESHYLKNNAEYKDHLFLPFNDLTNGLTTYGGGRYIDLIRQNSNKIEIDFNKSYNPYCAYSNNYSCPIPPIENFLETEIIAGIKLENSH